MENAKLIHSSLLVVGLVGSIVLGYYTNNTIGAIKNGSYYLLGMGLGYMLSHLKR